MWTYLLGRHNSPHLQLTSTRAGGSEMWAAGHPSCPAAALHAAGQAGLSPWSLALDSDDREAGD